MTRFVVYGNIRGIVESLHLLIREVTLETVDVSFYIMYLSYPKIP